MSDKKSRIMLPNGMTVRQLRDATPLIEGLEWRMFECPAAGSVYVREDPKELVGAGYVSVSDLLTTIKEKGAGEFTNYFDLQATWMRVGERLSDSSYLDRPAAPCFSPCCVEREPFANNALPVLEANVLLQAGYLNQSDYLVSARVQQVPRTSSVAQYSARLDTIGPGRRAGTLYADTVLIGTSTSRENVLALEEYFGGKGWSGRESTKWEFASSLDSPRMREEKTRVDRGYVGHH